MIKPRVFLSHSSHDKRFADTVVSSLKGLKTEPWIDKSEIISGDRFIDDIGRGLKAMDAFVVLISRESINSGWVREEWQYAVVREIDENLILMLPFLIDDTPINDLPWFMRSRHAPRISKNDDGARQIAAEVNRAIERRVSHRDSMALTNKTFKRDQRVDELILDIRPGQWNKAYAAALKILTATSPSGDNELFWSLFRYLDFEQDWDVKFSATSVVEGFAQLAPNFFDRSLLQRMASNGDFSVRSAAAAICQEFANWCPDRIPLDILIKLADHKEDWYVMAPAMAAMKSLCFHRPAVLRVFYTWLHSDDAGLREHGAGALWGIARKEPEILDREQIAEEVDYLGRLGDTKSKDILAGILPRIPKREGAPRLKYGI